MEFLFVIVLIVLLCIVPVMASKRGRSGVGWFFLSLLTTPILGMLLLAILGDSDAKKRQKLIEEEELRHRIAQKYASESQIFTKK